MVLLRFTQFWVEIGFSWVSLDSDGFYWVLLGSTTMKRIELG